MYINVTVSMIAKTLHAIFKIESTGGPTISTIVIHTYATFYATLCIRGGMHVS